jgi:hypothetical protein
VRRVRKEIDGNRAHWPERPTSHVPAAWATQAV